MQGVLYVLHGNQAVTHQKVFIAFILNDLLQLIPVYLAGGGVRVLPGPGMLAAVRDIFGGLVKPREVLFSQLLIHFKEPAGVKTAVIELLRGQRGVSCDHGLPAVIEPLVHMGHKVITAAGKALHAQDLLRHFHPLRRVHGHLDHTVLRDLRGLYRLLQVFRCFGSGHRIADLDQVRKAFLFTGPVIEGIVGAPVQRVFAHGPQNLHEPGNAFDTGDAGDGSRENSRRIAPLEFHIEDQIDQVPVDFIAQPVITAFLIDGMLFIIDRREAADTIEGRADKDRFEQSAQIGHSVFQADHIEDCLIQEIPADHAQLTCLDIRIDVKDVIGRSIVGHGGNVLLQLIDPVRLIKQREYVAELLLVLIAGSSGHHGPELVRPQVTDMGIPLVIQASVFGGRLLQPPDLFRQGNRLQKGGPGHLLGQHQMLLAGNDIQECRIQGVHTPGAVKFGIRIMISGSRRAEHGLIRLDICVHIQHRRRVIPRYAGKIKVKEDLRLPDDRFIDLFPEFRERIPGLRGITVLVLRGVKAVLQQLLFSGGSGIFQLAMVQDKSPDPVKISVQFRGAQAEIVLQQPLRGVRPDSGNLCQKSGCRFLLILIRQFFNILPDIRQVRSVLRRCIVKSVPFRVQNTAGAFAGRDLLIKDLFLV